MKKAYVILGCIEAFTALGAIPAGLMFLWDTSGAKVGQTTALLAHSPFSSFLIPALFLLLVNGMGSVAGAVLSFFQNRHAALAGMTLGIILCLWILIQVYWIGFTSWLQPVFFVVGVAEAECGWLILKKNRET